MKWIKVEDQLPNEGQRIIYYFKHTGISVGYYEKKKYPDELGHNIYGNMFHSSDGFLIDDVTHWMPLPEYPLEEDDE